MTFTASAPGSINDGDWSTGYSCTQCHQWVPSGTSHVCYGPVFQPNTFPVQPGVVYKFCPHCGHRIS